MAMPMRTGQRDFHQPRAKVFGAPRFLRGVAAEDEGMASEYSLSQGKQGKLGFLRFVLEGLGVVGGVFRGLGANCQSEASCPTGCGPLRIVHIGEIAKSRKARP